jgi:molybdopterin/thiamine biosynthesis adenylyltransferase
MKTVTIVGVGALGSHVAQFLRNEAHLRVIDFDRVEAKNMLSQFHGKPGGGKLKVEALKGAMQFLWGTKLDTRSSKLESNNVFTLLTGSDLVIDCLDNGEARRLVQKFARGVVDHLPKFNDRTPLLHGALAADGAFGRVIWDEHFVIDDGSAGEPTCEDGVHLPFIVTVSSLIARSAQVFLKTGKKLGWSIAPTNITLV